MRARRAIVAAVLALGLLAAGAAAADDDAAKAKIKELERRIADAYRSRPAYGNRRAATPEGAAAWAAWRERYAEIQKLNKELTKLRLGPELAAQYEEYWNKNAELTTRYREVYADKTLDAETKRARYAEIRKKQTALSTEYGDVIKKANAIRMSTQHAAHRRQRLEKLKNLLTAGDEEWKVLEPHIEELLKLQGDLNRKRITARTFAASAGSYLWKYPRPTTTLGALAEAVKKEAATNADIQAKIEAVRKARAQQVKEVDDLEKKIREARKGLRELITIRQEGTLIVERVLD